MSAGDPTVPEQPRGSASRPRRAFLALGSNLGDRARYLRDAVDTLRAVDLRAVSPVYETEPVGGPGGQAPYLNLVAELVTDRPARDLLGVCHRLESAAGRVRDERWGPRTLDVDVVWIDGESVDEPDLAVPHPRMWERRFVLAPLRDLAPDLVDDQALKRATGHVVLLGALDDLAAASPDRAPGR